MQRIHYQRNTLPGTVTRKRKRFAERPVTKNRSDCRLCCVTFMFVFSLIVTMVYVLGFGGAQACSDVHHAWRVHIGNMSTSGGNRRSLSQVCVFNTNSAHYSKFEKRIIPETVFWTSSEYDLFHPTDTEHIWSLTLWRRLVQFRYTWISGVCVCLWKVV